MFLNPPQVLLIADMKMSRRIFRHSRDSRTARISPSPPPAEAPLYCRGALRLTVLPLDIWSVRCQDFVPLFTTIRCWPLAICNVVGVLPTNTPSTSISAEALGDVIETVALAAGKLAATPAAIVGGGGGATGPGEIPAAAVAAPMA
jgi:hypothetical protein